MRQLRDVLPAAAVAMGVDVDAIGLLDPGWQLPEAHSYVVVLIDGLGYQLLSENRDEAPYLASLLGQPGECGIPSTTATSLTSIGTGLGPGQHGVVGYTSRIPGTDQLLEALHWDREVDPREWQPHPTVFERLGAIGVDSNVVSKGQFATSGLTGAAQRGAAYVPAADSEQRLAAVASLGRPSLTYYYDSDLDAAGHRYGVDSVQWQVRLSDIDDEVSRLREQLHGDVRLLVVADHGMVDSPREHRIDVDSDAELASGVQLVGGEARFRHLYCSVGAADDVAANWRERLADRAVVLTRDEAIAKGWFGPVDAHVDPRIGDVVVASLGDFAVMAGKSFPKELSLVGMHGSITQRETQIPVLIG